PHCTPDDFLSRTLAGLERLKRFRLPASTLQRVPEGFAYYGLYPEQYSVAAQHALSETSPTSVVVIGLRSIGTTLSSVVERTIATHDVPVSSYTVRPRGSPFERALNLDRSLLSELQRAIVSGAHFFVVDEGPGMSGSSFASAVAALIDLSSPRHHVVLFPSYPCNGGQMCNTAAQRIWAEQRSFVADFELAWISRGVSEHTLLDISAGAWRDVPMLAASRGALCHPQHERRKYLTLDDHGRPLSVMRFAGFGAAGRDVRERAERLSDSGITSKAVALSHGMLVLEFVSGKPLQRSTLQAADVSSMLDYVSWRWKQVQVSGPANTDVLFEMACHNGEKAIGGWTLTAFERLMRDLVEPCALTIVDGRMAPDEWLRTDNGLRKLDAFDHGDDHFFPGPCDIAWDIAGICTEFGLDNSQIGALAAAYSTRSGDRWIIRRLPFYLSAYRAFRIGYCHWASVVLPDATARARFRRRMRWYRLQLIEQLRESAVCYQPIQY
ncbi:MAG TPA: hypothetical protein VIV60_33525, partial [Polyangiaceae bacterium]